MNEGYLKYFGVLLCLFAIAAILPPASAYAPCGDYEGSFSYTGAIPGTLIYSNYSGADPFLRYDWFKTGAIYPADFIAYTYAPIDYLTMWGNTTYLTVYTLNQTTTCAHRQDIYYRYTGSLQPIANFTATPLSGTVPLTVSFTDTSQNLTGAETWNWSVSPAPGVSITTPAAQNTQMTFATIGNYTIAHGMSNANGSSIATKTDYIYVYNSTSTTTLHVTAINALNAYPIHGAQVNLHDVQNNSWSNTTTTDGTGTITALNSHTINAHVSASGYSDNEKLGIPVTNTYDSVLLFPANMTSVIAGNVTLFVSVFDSADHSKPIVGAGVTVITPTGAQGQFTNSGGSAQFVVPNKTTVLIDATATGYLGGTQSTYTGTGSGGSASVTATIYLSKKTVTPTAVITTLPGGGYPTTQPTLLDGCEDPMSAECQASQNEYSMGWLSQNGLLLIQFFIICFIVFMLKGMGR